MIIENELLENGFIKIPSPILDIYQFDISRNKHEFRVIACTIQQGNQYVYLREGSLRKERMHDDIFCVFNGDYEGQLTIEFILKLKQIFNK